jgi:TolB-like protein/class 3 adenylate cyclase
LTVHRKAPRLDGSLDGSRPARSPHAVALQQRELDPATAIDKPEGSVIMASSDEPAPRATLGMTRRLAAILSADVVGYSRLMGEDEEATVRTVTVYRDVMAALVQQYRGRVVDSPGDNLLAEFASVLDAVQCAVAIQRELNARNAALSLPRRMQFRVGLNLGDVIPDGARIYGDGVNIAARLEGLAEAGGICVSGTVYDQVATKLPLTYKCLGQQTVKNIARPVRAYRVQVASGPAACKGHLRHRRGARLAPKVAVWWVGLLLVLGGGVASWRLFVHPSLPDKPSLAVLPFVNLSGDPEQEYVSDGMTEDLITELSRLSGLFVIARTSVFTYKGKVAKPDQVRWELGVRYLLEGSVRTANNRMRITAQLVDATTGYHLWAQSYDRDFHDIFAVQEEIARMIAWALAVRLTPEEEEHMGRPYTSSPVAWEYFMRGLALYQLSKKEANAQARELFEKAISLDPEFARAYAMLAATHRQDGNQEWTQDRDISEALAYHLAHYAVELARSELEPKPSLPYTLEQWGWVLLYIGTQHQEEQHQAAIKAAEEAVQRNPNFANGYALLAHVLTYLGKPEESLRQTDKAFRLDPKASLHDHYHRGHAYYVQGYLTGEHKVEDPKPYYQQAEKHFREALKRNNNYRPARSFLVAVLWELGRQEEAKHEMAILRDTGRPQAFQNLKRFQDYVTRGNPYADRGITTHLMKVWQDAESRS